MQSLPLIALIGQTAVGKSALLYRLLGALQSEYDIDRFEIINADSIQQYRYLDIGASKPSRALRRRYRHHLIDTRDPSASCSVQEFVTEARAALLSILRRACIPILCGGSIYFVYHLLYGLPNTPPPEQAIRKELEARLLREGLLPLYTELQSVDRDYAARISHHDRVRILRGLEIYHSSGHPPSYFARAGGGDSHSARVGTNARVSLASLQGSFQGVLRRSFQRMPHGSLQRSLHDLSQQPFQCLIIKLIADRALLKERIEARVHEMWRLGLPQEVARLVAQGYGSGAPALRAIGYRQFFNGAGALRSFQQIGEAERIQEEIIRATLRYAKHQRTFMRQIYAPRHYYTDEYAAILRSILCFLALRVHGDILDHKLVKKV